VRWDHGNPDEPKNCKVPRNSFIVSSLNSVRLLREWWQANLSPENIGFIYSIVRKSVHLQKRGPEVWNSTEAGGRGGGALMGVCSRTNFIPSLNCLSWPLFTFSMVSLELVISLRSQGQAPGELSAGVLVFGDTKAGRGECLLLSL
jgi:hypothetical protein